MTAPYHVSARKYRPSTFAALIGQEAMVRTLTNAIATGRIAHAFILTGVRGIGKTTTARIIARALNCVGPDGKGGPTIEPCGVCEHCRAILEDRHVDVLEMDAASRTGVDNIRELIETVRYRPVSARFKIYIIDEVHMLSKSAFNALLKTLEEPPPDIKFIFATTEIHKVPVTVLSRCQRFSLRRVPLPMLAAHLSAIAEKEGATIAEDAVQLLARAADGSVRDGLSLLDQAIAQSGGAPVEAAAVRDMLGLADRQLVLDLLEAVFAGDVKAALERLEAAHAGGGDPVMVLQDLLDLTHFLTRLKITPEAGKDDPALGGLRERAAALVQRLSMPVLTRCWQMLLKGLTEAQAAPVPMQATEMVLIRLAYAAELPPPAELVRALGAEGARTGGNGGGVALSASAATPVARATADMTPPTAPRAVAGDGATARLALAAAPAEAAPSLPHPQSFAEVLELFERNREAVLRSHLVGSIHLVHFEPGRIEFRPEPSAPPNLANRLGQLLQDWTGMRWVVSVSAAAGAPTLKQQEETRIAGLRTAAAEHPLVRAALETFPGAVIEAVREIAPAAEPDAVAADDNEGDEAS